MEWISGIFIMFLIGDGVVMFVVVNYKFIFIVKIFKDRVCNI